MDELLSGPPLNLWNDPALRGWRAHVTAQWQAQERAVFAPPFAALCAEGRSLDHRQVLPASVTPDVIETSDVDTLIDTTWCDVGAALPEVQRYVEWRLFDRQPVVLTPRVTAYPSGCGWTFVRDSALSGSRWFIGPQDQAVATLALPPVSDVAPFALHMDMAPMLARWDDAYAKTETRLARLAPQWRTWTPRLDVTGEGRTDGWHGHLALQGVSGVTLHASPLAALARADAVATVSVGTTPACLVEAALWALNETGLVPDGSGPTYDDQGRKAAAEARRQHARIRAVVDRLTPELTGDVLFQARWEAGPFPQSSLCVGVRPGTALDQALVACAEALGMQQVQDVAGATQAWSMFSSIGLVYLAQRDGRCVMATDADEAARLLAGKIGDAHLDVQAGAEVRVDTPALARTLLPLAYGMMAQVKGGHLLSLGPMWVRGLHDVAWSVMRDIPGLPDDPVNMAQFLRSGGCPQALDEIRRIGPVLFIEGDILAQCAACVSGYRRMDSSGPRQRQIMTVMRVVNGFEIAGAETSKKPLTVEQIEKKLVGWKHILGPVPAQLALCEPPVGMAMDSRLLPPMASLIAHLPPWRLVLRPDKDGMAGEETGLPVASMLTTHYAIHAPAAFVNAWTNRLQQAAQARRDAVEARYHDVIETVQHIGNRMRDRYRWEARSTAITTPSALARDIGLDVSDCAALAGGTPPASVEALDQIGRWQHPTGPLDPLWVFRLDATWCVVLGSGGNVWLSDTMPDDVPRLPPIKTAADNF
jgi:hypothetical protein